MDHAPTAPSPESATSPTVAPGRGGWFGTTLIAVIVATAYLANGRAINTYDTVPMTELTLALARGEGFYLDRFWLVSIDPSTGRLMPFIARAQGHLVSRYPVGPALLALPLVVPQVAMWDLTARGWDRLPMDARDIGVILTKRAAVVITVLVVVMLHRLLRRLGLRRAAGVATLAAALGSELWTIASQALWQHGPAALALLTAVVCLLPCPPPRIRLLLAGCAAAAVVIFRPIDLLLAAWIFAYVAWQAPNRLGWFIVGPIVGGTALLFYNFFFFDNIAGGQAELEALHPKTHGVAGPWTGDLLEGFLGTLFSPNRGLFVFSPWVLVALACAPLVWKRLRPWPVLPWMLWGLVPFLLMFSKYAVWWGGHCFGPRYWTDVMPFLAILFGFALEWALEHSRPVAALMVLAVAWSIAAQAIGAFCYPSTWSAEPTNVDLDHQRLWNWHDTELRRCLIEGRQPATTVIIHRGPRPKPTPPAQNQTRPLPQGNSKRENSIDPRRTESQPKGSKTQGLTSENAAGERA